ncbi:MAG: lipid-binding SYLF domain-containing protein [Neomegalonema sp.]|nr:lipid-binding SYLF domain-containing protein [Neomegalonema sp.]
MQRRTDILAHTQNRTLETSPCASNRRAFLRNGAALAAAAAAGALTPSAASAKSAEDIEREVADALDDLFRLKPEFRTVYDRAYGALVIPEILKAGFIVGGAYGEGALVVNGLIESYWSFGSASVGFQAGAQRTRQVLFFMTQRALSDFRRSTGFELGAEVEATVIDEGAEVEVDTTKDRSAIIVVAFGREGLLGGASVKGGRYERIKR